MSAEQKQDPSPAKSMIALLLAATVAVDLLAVGRLNTFLERTHSIGTVAGALIIAQLFLLTLWLGLGASHWLVRLACFGIGIACIRFLISFDTGRIEFVLFVTMCVLLVFPFFLLLVVARCLGFRWMTPQIENTNTTTPEKPRFQFTLARMFAWTTFVAFGTLFIRYAPLKDVHQGVKLGSLAFPVPLYLSVRLAALNGLIVARWGSIMCVVLFISTLIAFLMHRSPGEFFGFIFLTLTISSLFVAAWVEALKTVGIRIHRVGKPVARKVETVTQQAETVSTQAPEGIDTDREGPN